MLAAVKKQKGHWFEIFIFAIKSSRYCRLVLSSDIFSLSAALERDAFNNPPILAASDSKKWRLNCYGWDGAMFEEPPKTVFFMKATMTLKFRIFARNVAGAQVCLMSPLQSAVMGLRWRRHRKRFRIETMFSDFKGLEFQLQKPGLVDPMPALTNESVTNLKPNRTQSVSPGKTLIAAVSWPTARARRRH
ncbi:MAG: hypothetical protein LUQ56_03280 [Methylococcaceae bacterium]|nr:hypothetical protein [Methylococcaceae bacterium]